MQCNFTYYVCVSSFDKPFEFFLQQLNQSSNFFQANSHLNFYIADCSKCVLKNISGVS